MIVLGDGTLRFFMVALSIDVMCEFADALFLLLLNRPEAAKSPRRPPSCERGSPFLYGVIGISPLNGDDPPYPPLHRF